MLDAIENFSYERSYLPYNLVLISDLVRLRNSGHSSQTLLLQQHQQRMPMVPETPKPTAFDRTREMPKWSSMKFGRQSSPLMGKTADDVFAHEFVDCSPAKRPHQSSSRRSDFFDPLTDMANYSQRTGGYRYEKMNCDLGFRFDCPNPVTPLISSNLFNANIIRSSRMPQSPSNKMSIALRRVTFTTRAR